MRRTMRRNLLLLYATLLVLLNVWRANSQFHSHSQSTDDRGRGGRGGKREVVKLDSRNPCAHLRCAIEGKTPRCYANTRLINVNQNPYRLCEVNLYNCKFGTVVLYNVSSSNCRRIMPFDACNMCELEKQFPVCAVKVTEGQLHDSKRHVRRFESACEMYIYACKYDLEFKIDHSLRPENGDC